MPNNLNLKIGMGFEGRAVGVTTNTAMATPIARQAVLTSLTGSGKQVYARWANPLTIPATSTTTLDLQSGLVNPLGESITGAADFATVLGCLIQHASGSPSAGIEAFGGTITSQFQGPLGTTCSVALAPGRAFGFNQPANVTGYTVAADSKNIQLRNLGTTVATVNVLIAGTV
jgi:hypothetical protein